MDYLEDIYLKMKLWRIFSALSIIEKFNGGPVGIEALASSIGEEQTTIEDVYEPYLLQNGFLKRTNRGRMVTKKAYEHLNIEYNE